MYLFGVVIITVATRLNTILWLLCRLHISELPDSDAGVVPDTICYNYTLENLIAKVSGRINFLQIFDLNLSILVLKNHLQFQFYEMSVLLYQVLHLQQYYFANNHTNL